MERSQTASVISLSLRFCTVNNSFKFFQVEFFADLICLFCALKAIGTKYLWNNPRLSWTSASAHLTVCSVMFVFNQVLHHSHIHSFDASTVLWTSINWPERFPIAWPIWLNSQFCTSQIDICLLVINLTFFWLLLLCFDSFLSNNQFSGTIPDFLGKLSKLTYLYVSLRCIVDTDETVKPSKDPKS